MSVFPKTRAAAGYAATRSRGELTRYHSSVLLRRLDACEAALAYADGQMAAAPARGLLRGLMQAARDLACPPWLAARGDDPDIAALTALEATPGPPGPAGLDEILSRILWARFAPDSDRDDSRPGRQVT